eukprot:TRINITY_DN10010_c0_g1_i1.p1 TRINITY_DN10010_c0_g1~~TRINITY_DN10010_c0_g1_i1.p1  ORF type:complete len:178 (+),score=34.96 TRINITY_DN10010_c0_g1_i1:57-536(+)
MSSVCSSGPPLITIYHNPKCGTSRNVLALIRNSQQVSSNEDIKVIEYLKTPPTRLQLVELIKQMNITPRALLRERGNPLFGELNLGNPSLTDDQIIDAMLQHPILINRPIVVTPKGVKLCRPSEVVLELLESRQKGAFAKEDGEKVVDELGQPIKKSSL